MHQPIRLTNVATVLFAMAGWHVPQTITAQTVILGRGLDRATRRCFSRAWFSSIHSSGDTCYDEERRHDRGRSMGSPWSWVRLSAIILFVGTMQISMLLRRSSMAVGLEGECKWSYRDLQSVFNIGWCFFSKDLASRKSKGPCWISCIIKDSHSTALWTWLGFRLPRWNPRHVSIYSYAKQLDSKLLLHHHSGLLRKRRWCIQPGCDCLCWQKEHQSDNKSCQNSTESDWKWYIGLGVDRLDGLCSWHFWGDEFLDWEMLVEINWFVLKGQVWPVKWTVDCPEYTDLLLCHLGFCGCSLGNCCRLHLFNKSLHRHVNSAILFLRVHGPAKLTMRNSPLPERKTTTQSGHWVFKVFAAAT